MHRIAVLAFDVTVAFDLGIPAQVFPAADQPGEQQLYSVSTATSGRAPVRTSAGFAILPDHGLELLDAADTVIVPGVHRSSLELDPQDPALAALRAAHERGARIMSICTGAFVLAAAGLLAGRPATTHWAYADRFRRAFPDVELRPDVLFVDDGDVLTSAGVAAGVDLCLHVLRRDHGSEVANRAARRCVVPPWRDGGQSQFIDRPMPPVGDASTASARAWALTRLDEPLDLDALARHARMSVRTFTRRFRDETGVSPGRWLTHQRIEHARRLLETTDLPIDQVATRAGFGTATSLRQHLHAAIGVAPAAYRRTFRR
ncbi:transcriptional regulator GlxA family with amidase domain [Allocatelliglobosispora scoriae]|uniref:Transcriptional regulator GlxA family with amidase domain n=1 Tax=Allocatelliglobosispora scoriae TaxID=643052 RepID=A0A841BNS4_9ACTN|nr:helix-turn-helix domain-containing protein [Allocatelliglobosispora scoriae]MBB5869038.1 transcriptional regulator GlxA family with amidase domain [Allocatelliglobosispora scoriae]